jgi:hypothetical protein
MLAIYQAVCEDDIDRLAGEESEIVRWQEQPLQVSDLVGMHSDDTASLQIHHRWQVVKTESYSNGSDFICVAMVQRSDLIIPNESEWTVNCLKEGCPNLSFYVYLAPDQKVISYGWSMDGDEPDRQLYNYETTSHLTLMKSSPSKWQVDRVDCYTPVGKSDYSRIHLAWCVAVKEAIAA